MGEAQRGFVPAKEMSGGQRGFAPTMNQIFNRRDQTPKRQRLRDEMPLAERILWKHLRSEALGVKFRRQVSVGVYVVDFYCPRLRLALELDGESHAGEDARAYDAVRQSAIEALGIMFLRFSNEEIYRNTSGVVETIAHAVTRRSEALGIEVKNGQEALEQTLKQTPSVLRTSPPHIKGRKNLIFLKSL